MQPPTTQDSRVCGGNAASNRRRIQRIVNRAVDLNGFFAEGSGTLAKAVQQQDMVLVMDETKLKNRQSVMLAGQVVFADGMAGVSRQPCG